MTASPLRARRQRRSRQRPLLGAVVALMALAAASAVAQQPEETLTVYTGGMQSGFYDAGWSRRDLKPGQPAKIDLSGYGGWVLAHRPLSGRFTTLQFLLGGDRVARDALAVQLGAKDGPAFPAVRISPLHRRAKKPGWQEVTVSMRELNPSGRAFDRIQFRAWRGLPRGAPPKSWIFLNAITLGCAGPCPNAHAPSEALHASTAPASGVDAPPQARDVVQVSCDQGQRAISDGIYGIAFNARKDAKHTHQWALSPTARRWGGNSHSRYNPMLGNAWNTAYDWYFQNVDYVRIPGWSWRNFLNDNSAHGVQAALTLPLLGWVAKDTHSYSFSVKALGPQKATAPERKDAGNGLTPEGKELRTPPPTTTSVAAGPDFMRRWVRQILARDQARGERAVRTWILGNEPMLWNSTHRDVHPDPTSYDELWQKTRAMAQMVRQADPTGRIAGPAAWGWPAYFSSAVDAKAGYGKSPDRKRHGNTPLLAWYLQQAKRHEQKTGEVLLDLLDVHFYPPGVFNDRADPDTAALRVRSVRSLWDESYVEETWIKEPVALIPRMQKLIAENYPGRGLMIGEYNFGGQDHISGALALAQALGWFGRLGVDEAYYWTYPPKGSPAFYAFRAFRNYDGAGARFGELSLPVKAPPTTQAFASLNLAGDQIVVVLVNTAATTAHQTTMITRGCGTPTASRAFQLSEQRTTLAPVPAPLSDGEAQISLPPWSVSVVELSVAPAP